MTTGEQAPTVTVWNDYICPWAYAARPHTDWLRANGIEVDMRFYELHPNIGPEGRATRPGGRLDQVFDHIASECAKVDLDFNKPDRTPNSHHCLEIMELVRLHHQPSLAELDEAMARAHWVDGLALDDPTVVAQIVSEVLGAEEAAALNERVAEGEGTRLLAESRDTALDLGVTATPAWRIGELTITGLHAPEQFQRWAGRVLNLS